MIPNSSQHSATMSAHNGGQAASPLLAKSVALATAITSPSSQLPLSSRQRLRFQLRRFLLRRSFCLRQNSGFCNEPSNTLRSLNCLSYRFGFHSQPSVALCKIALYKKDTGRPLRPVSFLCLSFSFSNYPMYPLLPGEVERCPGFPFCKCEMSNPAP